MGSPAAMLVNGEDTATPGNALKILIHSLLEKQNCDAARRSHKIGVRVHTPISTTFLQELYSHFEIIYYHETWSALTSQVHEPYPPIFIRNVFLFV